MFSKKCQQTTTEHSEVNVSPESKDFSSDKYYILISVPLMSLQQNPHIENYSHIDSTT